MKLEEMVQRIGKLIQSSYALSRTDKVLLAEAMEHLTYLDKQRKIEHSGFEFERGDHVIKSNGDYSFVGRIVVGYMKLNGHDRRYIVEDDRGLNLIMNGGQLRHYKGEKLDAKGS